MMTLARAVGLFLALPAVAGAEPLGAATLAAWDAEVRKLEARLETESARTASFDGLAPSVRAALQRGEAVIENVDDYPTDVPNGLVHLWRGRVFIPGVSLAQLIAVVRDPVAHKQEDVLEARLLDRSGDTDRIFLKITRSALVTVAYNTEHIVTYHTRGPALVTSRSEATKIAELDGLGTPEEREKPSGADRGFLQRMHAYWRYESTPGGVLVTLDSLTLSRTIPWALSPVASPIVNRIARESVIRTLRSLRARFTPR